jgi:group II intron reverse transcriptase/maturase
MAGTSGLETISPKLQRIAALAKQAPDMAFTTLAHHIDVEWLREAYRRTRKGGAPGTDGVTAKKYEEKLEENLLSLLDRVKSGSYRAPPVRRVHIPKGDGKSTRPLGIPAFEDKVLQRAIAMVLEAIYETEFLDCSYGFRPKRSAHGALEGLWSTLSAMGGGWVIELDIQKYFDNLDHAHLRQILQRRVRDGVLLRLIGKWLNAGVLEEGALSYPESGTPQGGVISPLLANIYLHEVLDSWFEQMVKPVMRGRAALIRYADDAVLCFEREDDARRVMNVLSKRFEKYGLTLHPEKSRLVEFRRPKGNNSKSEPPKPPTFDFLGFTHFWGLSQKKRWVVKRKTASSRLRRAITSLTAWCRKHRHLKVREQHQALTRKMQGHYGYFGITSNYPALARFAFAIKCSWRKWLSRRSQKAYLSWEKFERLLRRYPLPKPRVVHSAYRPAANP